VKPLTGAEAQNLRDEQQKLNEKRAVENRPFTADEQARIAVIRDHLEEVNRRNSIPAIAEIVQVQISIAKDAAPGPRQLRVETPGGLTNPIIFCVGNLPEISRKPTRVPPQYNVVNGATPFARPQPRSADLPTEVTLPVVLNGQMMPATRDQYRFHARWGQQLIVQAAARELLPYVSDAVPGWFQAAVTLREAKGKEVASAGHYLFHPDPVIQYEVPADGDYIVEIHDSIYRGREDFVYRLSIGELPFVTSVFPLGARVGAKARVEQHGWNLKSRTAAPLVRDTLPEAIAKSGISRPEKAQRVKLPVIVNGRVTQPGEAEVFRIQGTGGEAIVAEVYARRLGSPLDSWLRLTDARGKELGFNDDFEDKGAGLLTHHADSYLSFKLPAKGTYYLWLADAQKQGGPDYCYRLRVSHPRPDFELRVVPSSLNLRAGSTVPVTVYALRRDGFNGDIALKLADAPPDFTLSGAAIPSGQDKVRVTLTVPRTPVSLPLSIQMTGRATIDGREVTRTAVPAEDMEQAFAYRHLVVEDAWMVRVIGTGAGLPWRAPDKPVKLAAGAATTLDLLIPPQRLQQGVQIALNDPPEGITIQSVTPARDGLSVLLRVQGDKAKAGLKGNLILDAYRDVAPPANAPNQQRRRQQLGTLPAIPFEVVAPQ
jgi:hypothetical protein